MICDYQTNKVYLAEGIKGYQKVAENLLYALYKEGVETEYLPLSKSKKHVWARDYMPVQVGAEDFVKYVYRPDYLKEDPEYIPRYGVMVKQLGLPCRETRLVIDGGNVVKGESAVIMTDKVLRENALFKEDAVKAQLEKLFECRVCLIIPRRYAAAPRGTGERIPPPRFARPLPSAFGLRIPLLPLNSCVFGRFRTISPASTVQFVRFWPFSHDFTGIAEVIVVLVIRYHDVG